MRTRLKTYKEFLNSITIAYDKANGCKIFCNIKRYMMVEEKFKPWNTPDTRNTFLIKLYINNIIWKCNPSKKIQRKPGYEMLGKRIMYLDELAIICSTRDLVHKETGEITQQLTLVSNRKNHPFKVLITEVQL